MLGQILNKQLYHLYPDIDPDDRSTWPYYINMTGEYHESNTMMTVMSIDTGEEIPFTKENLTLHPITKSRYSPGNTEYDKLCEKYPEQTDLIKSIRYPISDIDYGIEAVDFSLINYDDSYLGSRERYDLVNQVKRFIKTFSYRWYEPSYNYEELYPLAFWSILLYQLPLVMVTRRIHNLHTQNVHDFFIWEYLESKGLDNYKDILDNDQALFLYRNINYIYGNRGKEETLKILAENILKKLRVNLVGKNIYHNTEDVLESCLWEPEIISENISKKTVDLERFETTYSLLSRLYNNGFDNQNSIDYRESVQQKLSLTQNNIAKTKFVELKKYIIDNKYENILFGFLLDNLIERVAENKLNFTIDYYNQQTNVLLEDIHIKDMILLYYYAVIRASNRHPTVVPSKYLASMSYVHKQEPTDYPVSFPYNGHTRYIRNYIDLDNMINQIPFYDHEITEFETFVEVLAQQFPHLIEHIRYTRNAGSTMVHLSMEELYKYLIPARVVDLNLSPHETMSGWLAGKENIQSLVTSLENTSDPIAQFDQLCRDILPNMIPVGHEKFFDYISIDSNNYELYERLKNLFVQLCSYNITFLDTSRESYSYIFLPSYTVDISSDHQQSDLFNVNAYLEDVFIRSYSREQYTLDPDVTGLKDVQVNEKEVLRVDTSNPVFIDNEETNKLHIRDGIRVDVTQKDQSRHVIKVGTTNGIKINISGE